MVRAIERSRPTPLEWLTRCSARENGSNKVGICSAMMIGPVLAISNVAPSASWLVRILIEPPGFVASHGVFDKVRDHAFQERTIAESQRGLERSVNGDLVLIDRCLHGVQGVLSCSGAVDRILGRRAKFAGRSVRSASTMASACRTDRLTRRHPSGPPVWRSTQRSANHARWLARRSRGIGISQVPA
jgi:hypothetical protein